MNLHDNRVEICFHKGFYSRHPALRPSGQPSCSNPLPADLCEGAAYPRLRSTEQNFL